MAVVTVQSDFGAQENKMCHCFHFTPFICHEVMGPDAMILVLSFVFFFFNLSVKPTFQSLGKSTKVIEKFVAETHREALSRG